MLLPSANLDSQVVWLTSPGLRFARVRAFASSDTFDIQPIGELVRRYLRQSAVSIDPFARNKRWATYTNDLNPKTEAEYHLDSAIFLEKLVEDGVEADLVLFDPPYCYDRETDVFTRQGWKPIGEITQLDEVAMLNTATDELEFTRPLKVIHRRYRGEMYRIKSHSVDLLITPNHRLWIKKSWLGRYDFEAVRDVKVKNIWMQKAAGFSGQEQAYFTLPAVNLIRHNRKGETHKPEKSIPMDLWLKFLGLFLSEGCCFSLNGKTKRNYRVGIAQKKPEVRRVIAGVLDELGYHYDVSKNDFRIQDKQLYSYLSPLGKAKEKYIPAEFKDLSPRQLNILMDYLMLGDGTDKTYLRLHPKAHKVYPHRTRSYSTASPHLMNDFCEIALKAGQAISVRKEIRAKFSPDPIYRIQLLRSKHFRVPTKAIQRIKDFDDEVYCLTVPSGIVLVKRNGRAVWCGNSVSQTKEMYEGIGLTLHMEDVWRTSGWKRERKAIRKLVKVGGYVICCNWNTNGIGEYYGFKAIELLDVCHGWGHPDTLVLVEQKIAHQMELEGF